MFQQLMFYSTESSCHGSRHYDQLPTNAIQPVTKVTDADPLRGCGAQHHQVSQLSQYKMSTTPIVVMEILASCSSDPFAISRANNHFAVPCNLLELNVCLHVAFSKKQRATCKQGLTSNAQMFKNLMRTALSKAEDICYRPHPKDDGRLCFLKSLSTGVPPSFPRGTPFFLMGGGVPHPRLDEGNPPPPLELDGVPPSGLDGYPSPQP